MRGTLRTGKRRHVTGGIIPAYAGNTNASLASMLSARDHPRVCGDHFSPTVGESTKMGSSPRMRGTLILRHHGKANSGIIPAYAGNTRAETTSDYYNWDHPRVCGEHAAVLMLRMVCLGSSPRMRGTPRIHHIGALRGGIIPAYAGNTCVQSTPPPVSRDHPRVCGEHLNV